MSISSAQGSIAYLPVVVGTGLFFALALFGWATSPANTVPIDDWRVILVLIVGVPAMLLGLFFTARLTGRDIRRQVAEAASRAYPNGPIFLYATSAIHFRGYRGGWFAWSVGGVFTMSRNDLSFRNHPGQFCDYEVRIPLEDMTRVIPCRVGLSGRGFRIERVNGPTEYFQIGSAFSTRSKQAAVDIESLRQAYLNCHGAGGDAESFPPADPVI